MRTEIHEQLLLLLLFLLTIDGLFPWPPRGGRLPAPAAQLLRGLALGCGAGPGGAACWEPPVEQAQGTLSAERPAEPVPALCLPLCLGLGCLLQYQLYQVFCSPGFTISHGSPSPEGCFLVLEEGIAAGSGGSGPQQRRALGQCQDGRRPGRQGTACFHTPCFCVQV